MIKPSVKKIISLSYDLSSSNQGLFKAEEVHVTRNSLAYKNTVFSGVATMSNTVGLTPHRFKFHLELYNRFGALTNSNSTGVTDHIIEKCNTRELGKKDYLKPPLSIKITAAHVDFGSGPAEG